MPVIGPEVVSLVENRAVMLTTFAFEGSFEGVKDSLRPEEGEV